MTTRDTGPFEATGADVSRLTDLIAQATAKDPELGADLDQELKQLSSRLPFGLNFERQRAVATKLWYAAISNDCSAGQ